MGLYNLQVDTSAPVSREFLEISHELLYGTQMPDRQGGLGVARVATVASMAALMVPGAVAADQVVGGGDKDQGANNPTVNIGDSVDSAVVALDVNNRSQLDKTFDNIQDNIDAYDDLDVSHAYGMQSRLESLTHEETDKFDIALGVYLSTINDDGFRSSYANALEGKDPKAARTDSYEEQMSIIDEAITSGKTRFAAIELNGTYENHGQGDEHSVFSEIENYTGVEGVKIIPRGFETITVKDGGGNDGQDVVCLNLEIRVPTVNPPESNPPEGNPPQDNPPEDNPPEDNPPEDNPPEDNPPEDNPPEDTPPEEDISKHDDGKKPGSGVEADDDPAAGDQWGAGDRPAAPGSSPHPEIRQPQQPTPEPLPEAPDTRPVDPTPPPQTNPIPPVAGPGTPGDGSEQPTPTDDVEI